MASVTINKSHVKALRAETVLVNTGTRVAVEDISKYDMLDFVIYFSTADTVSSISIPVQRLIQDTTTRFILERTYIASQSQTVYLIVKRDSNTIFSFESNGSGFYLQNIYGIKF